MNADKVYFKDKFRWDIESIITIIAIVIFSGLALFTGWFTFLTGEKIPPPLYVIATVMSIIVFINSIVKFHGKTNWPVYCYLLLPFIILIITILLNFINNRELLPQETASIIIYLTVILLLATNIKSNEKSSVIRKFELSKYISRKYILMYYGFILIGLSFWFWPTYGLFGIIPPVTSIVIIVGVISMWYLVRSEMVRTNVFGTEESSARKIIHKALGTIFTGFVLMITILWSLMTGSLNLHPNIVYVQSFLLMLLFFYFVGSFYCILSDLKKN